MQLPIRIHFEMTSFAWLLLVCQLLLNLENSFLSRSVKSQIMEKRKEVGSTKGKIFKAASAQLLERSWERNFLTLHWNGNEDLNKSFYANLFPFQRNTVLKNPTKCLIKRKRGMFTFKLVWIFAPKFKYWKNVVSRNETFLGDFQTFYKRKPRWTRPQGARGSAGKFYEAIKVLKHDANFAYQRALSECKSALRTFYNTTTTTTIAKKQKEPFSGDQNRKSIINIFAKQHREVKDHFKIENFFLLSLSFSYLLQGVQTIFD